MSEPHHTPNRVHSPAVYRRRRIFTAVFAVVVVVVIVLIVLGLAKTLGGKKQSAAAAITTSSSPSATRTHTPSPTATGSTASATASSAAATPSATSSAAAAPACDPGKLSLKASTDSPDYGAGKNPVFTLQVTNSASSPCSLNVGTSQMEFLVTQGDGRIFSSKDCASDPADLQKTLDPNKPQTAQFTWQRNHTVPGCSPVDPAVPAGPDAEYQLQVKLGDLSSDKVDFSLSS